MIDSTISARICADFKRYKRMARLDAMHAKYGAGPDDKTCGDCEECRRSQVGRRNVYKCLISGVTWSAASDWRKKWPACGRWRG